MKTLGLVEWTSRWLRIWQQHGQGAWLPVVIQESRSQLPLALRYHSDLGQSWLSSIFGSSSVWQLGWPAWHHLGLHPAEVLTDFLLGWRARRSWRVNGKLIGAKQLLRLFVELMLNLPQPIAAWGVMVPSYWEEEQAREFAEQLRSQGLNWLAAQPQDLVWASAAWQQHGPWSTAVFADLDDHALVVTRVAFQDSELVAQQRQTITELGRRVWLVRLMQACSELSIRMTRCDPLLSREAFQLLLLQLNDALPQLNHQSQVISLHTTDFHAELRLTPELASYACRELACAAANVIRRLTPTPAEVFLTQRLADMPGLVRAVYEAFGHRQPVSKVDEAHYLVSAGRLLESVRSDGKATFIWHRAYWCSLESGHTERHR